MEWLMMGAALITLLGSAITAASSSKSVRETNKANRELAEQQNEWNVQQWNRENEYNSPSAQVQRLKEAGLNPAMMYDTGGSVVNTSSSKESANLANQVALTGVNPLMGVGESMSQASQNLLQKEKTAAEVRNLDHNSEYQSVQTELIQKQTEGMQIQFENWRKQGALTDAQTNQVLTSIESINKNMQLADEQIKLYQSQTANLDEQTKKTQLENVWTNVMNSAQLKKLKADTSVSEARQAEIEQQVRNMLQQHDLLNTQIRIGQSDANIRQNQERLSAIELEAAQNFKQFRNENSDFYNEADYWSTLFGVVGSALNGYKSATIR